MVQGSGIDAPLNDTGRKQADLFYQAYKHHRFDKVYVSNLIRTYQSVEAFINKKIPFERLEGLNEISWGDQEGLPFDEASLDNYQEVTKAWQSGDYNRNVGGGETPIQVMERQKEAIKHILKKEDEENVLICMHGRAMRVLICWLLNYPLKNMDKFSHENLCLYHLQYTGSMFSVKLFDERGHLKQS